MPVARCPGLGDKPFKYMIVRFLTFWLETIGPSQKQIIGRRAPVLVRLVNSTRVAVTNSVLSHCFVFTVILLKSPTP